MSNQEPEIVGLALEKRVEPHVADLVEALFPSHPAGVIDPLPYKPGLRCRESAWNVNEPLLFQGVELSGVGVGHLLLACQRRRILLRRDE